MLATSWASDGEIPASWLGRSAADLRSRLRRRAVVTLALVVGVVAAVGEPVGPVTWGKRLRSSARCAWCRSLKGTSRAPPLAINVS